MRYFKVSKCQIFKNKLNNVQTALDRLCITYIKIGYFYSPTNPKNAKIYRMFYLKFKKSYFSIFLLKPITNKLKKTPH